MTKWETTYAEALDERFAGFLNRKIEMAQKDIDKFDEARGKHGLGYALEWHALSAYAASATKNLAEQARAAHAPVDHVIGWMRDQINRETESYFSVGFSANRAPFERAKVEGLRDLIDKWGGLDTLPELAADQAARKLVGDDFEVAREYNAKAREYEDRAVRCRLDSRKAEENAFRALAVAAKVKEIACYRNAVFRLVQLGAPLAVARGAVPHMLDDEKYGGAAG